MRAPSLGLCAQVWGYGGDAFEKGILRRGLIGAAKTLVVEGGPMLDFTVQLLQNQPWALVKPEQRPVLS